MQKKMLSPKEVAALLRVHPNSVYRWIDDGRLPARKTPGGKEWRIDIKDLPGDLKDDG